jgi:hypothetical protein
MLFCLVASSAGGVAERLRLELVEPALRRGWRVAITLTPTAAQWLDAVGELDRLRALTDLPVRSVGRMPGEPSPYGLADRYLFAPATATSIADGGTSAGRRATTCPSRVRRPPGRAAFGRCGYC